MNQQDDAELHSHRNIQRRRGSDTAEDLRSARTIVERPGPPPVTGSIPSTPSTPVRMIEATAIQAQIALARAQLPGGRGTGVSQAEIDQHTRARIVLDGEPTAQHLAAVAHQTAIASGDTAAIALDLAAARAHRDATDQATTEAIRPSPPRVARRRIRALRRRHRAGWAALAVIAVLVLRKRTRRSRRNS